MSLLAQQVAALTKEYRPPVPGHGRVHRLADDDSDPAPLECNTCKQLKPKDHFYERQTERGCTQDCRDCYLFKKKTQRIAREANK